MRRPGKELRGAACTISEIQVPRQRMPSNVEARTVGEKERAIKRLAIARRAEQLQLEHSGQRRP